MAYKRLESLNRIEHRIQTSPNPYRAVAFLAVNIRSRKLRGEQGGNVKARFDRLVVEHALEDAPGMIARYARKLLRFNVTLFEEVLLVFSLLEEIEALEELGLVLPDNKQAELKAHFLDWLNKNRARIRIILQDCSKSEFVEAWFYQAALESAQKS